MLLNNANGNYIKIYLIDTIANKVQYTEYEHDSIPLLTQSGILKSIDMAGLVNSTGLTDGLIYGAMVKDFNLENFVLSDDSQNWLSPSKGFRFLLPNDIILQSIILKDNLCEVIMNFRDEALLDDAKIIVNCKNNTIVYYGSVNEQYLAVLQPYIESGIMKIEVKK
jgi:hypothetical protein